ncbi:Purple acid phosphatase 23 [Camellia lanceoleosa]|uniref:Purple acid phosphatase 23 n=1 Tax=Camellia lanceoleosa TaxID=1840588 RepID=A0ACC0HVN2_9ERIC|nr:Purple acid phosphatase 23 [Camellia lanceoleosa]
MSEKNVSNNDPLFDVWDSQIGLNVTALDPSTVTSEVWYGKESGNYSMKMTGVSTFYNQLYPFEGLWNYTSGVIHYMKIDVVKLWDGFL